MKKAFKQLAIGTLLAGLAGYVAGLLTAPKSGKATRKDIKNAADHTISEAEKHAKQLHTELGELLDDAKVRGSSLKGKGKDELDDLVDKANAAKQKVREILSAIHEGDADDKDLKKALDESTKAIKHLKVFLKKKTD